jgi:hypothetical protein
MNGLVESEVREMMYLIYYKENGKRTWIMSTEVSLAKSLHEIWSNPDVTEV